MKKNTITKVLLFLVMLLLVFSMVACNKDGKKESSTTKLNAPTVTVTGSLASWKKVPGADKYCIYIYDANENLIKTIDDYPDKEYTMQDGEEYIEVVALPSNAKYEKSDKSVRQKREVDAAEQLINLLNGVQGFIDTWNSITVDDVLSADLALGGFFTTTEKKEGEASVEKRNSAALSVKANARKNNPEFMVDFKLNDNSYVTLGFKDNAILVREPLNYVNKNNVQAANAFKIDVSALGASVPVMMNAVMKFIAIADIKFESIIDSARTFLDSGFGMDIIEPEENGNEKTLSITMTILANALNMVGKLEIGKDIVATVDDYLGKYYDVCDAIKMSPILLDGNRLTYQVIVDKLLAAPGDGKLLNIVMTFDGKNVKKIDLVLDLATLAIAGLDNKFGLSVDLTQFEKTTSNREYVNIDATGFSAQNLEIDLGAALGVKGLAADAKATIRLADALANKNNKWATLTITDKNVAANAPATAYIDATGAYADFGPIFTMVNGTKGDLKTKYSATFKNDENQNINLVDTINSSIDNAFKTTVAAKLVELERKMAEKNSKDKKDNKPADSNTPSESSGESNEGGSDFMSFVMDVAKGFGSADDKIDYACSVVYPFIEKVDSAATGFLPDLEGGKKGTATQATVIKYAFERELADTNSCIADYALFYQNATTFEGLWNNIKACHTAGKAALTAATNAGNGKAGVQFFDPATEENDLLDYIAHFVKVPTIVEGEPNFENPGAINNAENLKDWLNWIFPVDNEYRDMVEDILGLGLVEIIDGGIYFEAINLGGFNGAVRAAASNAEGAVEYVSLSAGFGMKASAADNMAAIEAEVEFNAQNEGEYYIAVMAEELLDALCAYGHN